MTKLFLTTAFAALALSPVAAKAPAPMLTGALADPSRPQADRDRDAARKPAKLLALLNLKPGAKVVDFIMGGGYWTRILAGAVGPTGRIYAYQPAEFIQFRAAYGTEQDEAVNGRANVIADRQPLASFSVPPASVDAIITVQNWHDLHLKIVPPTFAGDMAKKLYAALKPGGVLLVVDHAGLNTGGAFADANTIHRGDKAATVAEITAAGFTLAEESKLYALPSEAEIAAAGFTLAEESKLYAPPSDPKTVSVFDPAIRGKTDQFVLKFVKPQK